MDRLQFLEKVFLFYGKELNAKNMELLKDYDLALSTPKIIDWEKLYNKTIKESETRFLPMPKWLIAKFDDCIKVDEQTYKINGGTGILKLVFRDKRTKEISKEVDYSFDMTNCIYSLLEIKAKFKAKYKDVFKDFIYYPPYMRVIGNTVIDMREDENVS